MATKPVPAKANPFGKPKQAADGGFTFRIPEDAKDGGNRGRIPMGKYVGRCTGVVFEKSKKSNNPMWTWEFTITKGKIGVGRTFKMWTVLTDDAAWKVVETLEALGVEVEPGATIKLNKKEVVGVGCTMHIVDDDGQDGDEEWSKLKKISAHPDGAGFRPGGLAGKKVKQEDDEDDDRDYPRELDAAEEEEEEDAVAADEDENEDEVDAAEEEEELLDDDSDALLGEDEDEEEPQPKRRPAAGKAPPKTARGKAPASLGGKKRR